MIFNFIVGALFQLGVYMTIIYTFDVANRAGLNIGISTSIWAINPFMTAVLDNLLYGTQIKLYQNVGMLALAICGILVSLSEFVNNETVVEQTKDPDAPPIYIAVLWSMSMPVVFAFQTLFQKWVVTRMGVNSMDWTFGIWGLLSLSL